MQTSCIVCLRPTSTVCGGCGDVAYCSRECQEDGWNKGHRMVCARVCDTIDNVDLDRTVFVLGQQMKTYTGKITTTLASMQKLYRFGRILGAGAFGVVFAATSVAAPAVSVAVKFQFTAANNVHSNDIVNDAASEAGAQRFITTLFVDSGSSMRTVCPVVKLFDRGVVTFTGGTSAEVLAALGLPAPTTASDIEKYDDLMKRFIPSAQTYFVNVAVMELVPGGSLRRYLGTKPASARTMAAFLLQLLCTLMMLNEVVLLTHFDLHDDNVFVKDLVVDARPVVLRYTVASDTTFLIPAEACDNKLLVIGDFGMCYMNYMDARTPAAPRVRIMNRRFRSSDKNFVENDMASSTTYNPTHDLQKIGSSLYMAFTYQQLYGTFEMLPITRVLLAMMVLPFGDTTKMQIAQWPVLAEAAQSMTTKIAVLAEAINEYIRRGGLPTAAALAVFKDTHEGLLEALDVFGNSAVLFVPGLSETPRTILRRYGETLRGIVGYGVRLDGARVIDLSLTVGDGGSPSSEVLYPAAALSPPPVAVPVAVSVAVPKRATRQKKNA